jgi:hypothetical protein
MHFRRSLRSSSLWWRASIAEFVRAGVLVLAACLAACAGRARAPGPPATPTPPAHARVLVAAGVPEAVAAVQLAAPYGELRTARPNSYYVFGTGRSESVAGWHVDYRFAAPPAAPGAPIDLDATIRREPSPEQPMRRAEFSRPVPADSVEALWAAAVVRAQAAADTRGRCSRFAVPGWSSARPVERRGIAAYIELSPQASAAASTLRAQVAIGYAVSAPEKAATGGAATRPPMAALTVIVEPVPQGDLFSAFETDTIACPVEAPPAGTPGRAGASRPDA